MANFFSKIGQSVFSRHGGSFVGIDIGSSAIKLVQARRQGGSAILETYGELSLGPYGGMDAGRAVQLPVEKLAEALQDLFKEANVTTKDCAFSIPISDSLISVIEMPALDEAQLNIMIPFEARRYIPVPITEVSLNWLIIPRDRQEVELDGSFTSRPLTKGPGRVNVLLVAIHNEALDRYKRIAKAVGLNVLFVEVEIFSAVRSVAEHIKSPVMVFDMGSNVTKLYIIDRGIVKQSHTINSGSLAITMVIARALTISVSKAEQIKRESGLKEKLKEGNIAEVLPTQLEHIFSETHRLMVQYQNRTNSVISKILLAGGGVLMPGFLEYAQSRLEAEVEYGNPFQKLSAPVFLEDVLRRAGPEFAVSIGLLLRLLQEEN